MLVDLFSKLTGHESIAVVALSVCLLASLFANWVQFRSRERLLFRLIEITSQYTELATRSAALFERLEKYLVKRDG